MKLTVDDRRMQEAKAAEAQWRSDIQDRHGLTPEEAAQAVPGWVARGYETALAELAKARAYTTQEGEDMRLTQEEITEITRAVDAKRAADPSLGYVDALRAVFTEQHRQTQGEERRNDRPACHPDGRPTLEDTLARLARERESRVSYTWAEDIADGSGDAMFAAIQRAARVISEESRIDGSGINVFVDQYDGKVTLRVVHTAPVYNFSFQHLHTPAGVEAAMRDALAR